MNLPLNKSSRITIGYIAQHGYDGIGMELLSGISDAARDKDVNLICALGGSTLTDREVNPAEITAIKLLNANSVDGLITWATSLRYYMEISELENFHKRFNPLPLVSIGMTMKNTPSILVDNYNGIRLIMAHLIEKHNLRRIAFIKGKSKHFHSDQRFQAYCQVLKEFNIAYNADLVVSTEDINWGEGRKAVRVLLNERHLQPKNDIEAIVTASDIFSVAAIEELKSMGIRVPFDIAVSGFNNRSESYTLTPTLTTIETHFYNHGYKAIEELLQLIHNHKTPRDIMMPTQLIIRQSCGCFEEPVSNAEITSPNTGSPRDFFKPNDKIKAVPNKLSPEQLADMAKVIRNCITDPPESYEPEWPEKILEHFWNQLSEPSTPESFLRTLEGYLSKMKIRRDLVDWQNVVSELRRFLLSQPINAETLFKAENLLHQGRVLIYKTLEYAPVTPNVSNSNLVQIGGVFNSTLTVAELMDVIEKELPKLGIPGCYLALYEDPKDPDHSPTHLILAFNDQGRIRLQNDQLIYPGQGLLPKEILPKGKRFNILVESCFYKDNQLGFVVFQMGPLEGAIYEILRTSFSSALHSALILQERINAEHDRERLLKALELKNLELEERNSDIKRVNEQLQLAINEAISANQAKSRFLANMSHEIRTPLNCIIGFAEIINNTKNVDQRGRYIHLIIEESEKLMELIGQLLDISKIESGKLKLNKESFNIYSVMDSITSAYAVIAKNKGLEYQSSICKDIPETIQGDPLRLRQILVNLIGNAIKFTLNGSITVSVTILEQTEPEIILLFQIKDTGIGIPQAKQDAIFDSFVQAEDSTTRKFGGTGLGTAISKELVQLMNGKIGVDSVVEKGSTFWFSVPLEKQTTQHLLPKDETPTQKEQLIPYQIHNLTVLLVEDYPTNREVAAAHLNRLGCQIIFAENGRIAVDKFIEFTVDLILMDIQMPEMDGYEATRLIRKEPKGRAIPILGMTANAFESDIQKCLELGMNDVITKPFRKDTFQSKVIYWLTQKSQTGAQETFETLAPNKNPPFDFEKVLQEFDGDREFLTQLILTFVTNVKSQLQEISAALFKDDIETIKREAHSIKGGASNLGADHLALLALDLENIAKSNNLTNAHQVLHQIENEIQQVAQYLKEI